MHLCHWTYTLFFFSFAWFEGTKSLFSMTILCLHMLIAFNTLGWTLYLFNAVKLTTSRRFTTLAIERDQPLCKFSVCFGCRQVQTIHAMDLLIMGKWQSGIGIATADPIRSMNMYAGALLCQCQQLHVFFYVCVLWMTHNYLLLVIHRIKTINGWKFNDKCWFSLQSALETRHLCIIKIWYRDFEFNFFFAKPTDPINSDFRTMQLLFGFRDKESFMLKCADCINLGVFAALV